MSDPYEEPRADVEGVVVNSGRGACSARLRWHLVRIAAVGVIGSLSVGWCRHTPRERTTWDDVELLSAAAPQDVDGKERFYQVKFKPVQGKSSPWIELPEAHVSNDSFWWQGQNGRRFELRRADAEKIWVRAAYECKKLPIAQVVTHAILGVTVLAVFIGFHAVIYWIASKADNCSGTLCPDDNGSQ